MSAEGVDRANAWLQQALGFKAFPWQEELLRRLVSGALPEALDIPTGLGKTAVMAVWLVARACGAAVPTRLVYVVDRRAVVDQATKVAEGLRRWVEENGEIKENLGLARSLPISTLRGQFADNREWLEDPASASIVVGTVDMVGSRLLFSGYGVTRRMRPYHAGLLGADTLLVIDEAHLVPPLESLVRAVARRQEFGGPRDALIPKLHVMSLSATGHPGAEAMQLSEADYADPVVAERIDAAKHLELRAECEARELAGRLAQEAREAVAGAPKRCVVFCGARSVAEQVYAELEAKVGKQADCELLVGARRVAERQQTAQWLREHGFSDPAGPSARAAYLVATSAGEVGVDFDADVMVSDLVPWERMVQRLGRVNRRGGTDRVAPVIVVPVLPQDEEETPKRVPDDESGDDEEVSSRRTSPAERLRGTAELLRKLPELANGVLDASSRAILALRRSNPERVDLASTPKPLRPPLTRALVETWSMTSLEEHSGRPEVAPWLRGWVDDEPQTVLIWRASLPVMEQGDQMRKDEIAEYLECAPPHLLEELEIESSLALKWLERRAQRVLDRKSTDESVAGDGDETRESRPLREREVFGLVVRDGEFVSVLRAQDLKHRLRWRDVEREIIGATVIVDVRLGGMRMKDGQPVAASDKQGSQAGEARSRKVSVGLLDEKSDEASEVPNDSNPNVPFRARIENVRDGKTSEEKTSDKRWREEARLPRSFTGEQVDEWLVLESDANAMAMAEDRRAMSPRRSQLLEEHQEWTEKKTLDLAERLGLSAMSHVLGLAAVLHDEGKRATHWQRAFRVSAKDIASHTVYAKTISRPNVKLLHNYRHELGSLPRAESDARVAALAPEERDLCLHLIAAHHGYARPILRTDGAEEPPDKLRSRAQEIALRFTRLEQQWGPWGLAWLEAVLRAADQLASRDNDNAKRSGPHG